MCQKCTSLFVFCCARHGTCSAETRNVVGIRAASGTAAAEHHLIDRFRSYSQQGVDAWFAAFACDIHRSMPLGHAHNGEERAIVARHTATAIVLRQGLQHRHGIKERAVHVPLEHEEGEMAGVTSKIMHELPELLDQETVKHEVALSREAGSVSATPAHH